MLVPGMFRGRICQSVTRLQARCEAGTGPRKLIGRHEPVRGYAFAGRLMLCMMTGKSIHPAQGPGQPAVKPLPVPLTLWPVHQYGPDRRPCPWSPGHDIEHLDHSPLRRFSAAEDSNDFTVIPWRRAPGIATPDMPTRVAMTATIHGDRRRRQDRCAVDSVEDMKTSLEYHWRLGSMTMNGAALPVFAAFIVAAEEQGVAEAQLTGTSRTTSSRVHGPQYLYRRLPPCALSRTSSPLLRAALPGQPDLDIRLPHARSRRDEGGAGADPGQWQGSEDGAGQRPTMPLQAACHSSGP
jgi:hypothetical protein